MILIGCLLPYMFARSFVLTFGDKRRVSDFAILMLRVCEYFGIVSVASAMTHGISEAVPSCAMNNEKT